MGLLFVVILWIAVICRVVGRIGLLGCFGSAGCSLVLLIVGVVSWFDFMMLIGCG